MRKLVTVRSINDLLPIPGADAIECAVIDGWNVVVKKGEFQQGDLCVYFEVDSFLPEGHPAWQFLVDKSSRMYQGQKGHVLRTVKLRGQLSQGLALKTDNFINDFVGSKEDEGQELSEFFILGEELTGLLGVQKWEPPIPVEIAGAVKGLFPRFISKTDQERVQNIPEVLLDTESQYEVTLKLDGTSMTVYANGGSVGVCSRNYDLKLGEENASNTLVKVATDTGLLQALRSMDRNLAVQGELMGPGIQGNREKLNTHTFFVFDIFSIDASAYVLPDERMQIFNELQKLAPEIKHVPIISSNFALKDIPSGPTMQNVLKFAESKSMNNDVAEGFVFKRCNPSSDGVDSFKVISNKYLLGKKE